MLGGDAGDAEDGGINDLCDCEGDIVAREAIDCARPCSICNRAASAHGHEVRKEQNAKKCCLDPAHLDAAYSHNRRAMQERT